MHSIELEYSRSVRASAGQPLKASLHRLSIEDAEVCLKLVSVLFLNQTEHQKP